MAKKYKKTTRTVSLILDSISKGLTQRESAILAGISEDTLSLWKRQDSDFSEQIRQKEIENKLSHINNIKKASERSWQASAWWLERKYKEEFSSKPKLDFHQMEGLENLAGMIKRILTPKKD